jgi:serine/threonine-protein kinase HipA
LHNHGFLHVAKDQWRLSPAFDVNPFPDRQRELKTWISEEAGPAASIDALMAVAAYFQLDKEAAVKILSEVERTISTWRVRGRELGMSAAELEQFADAFEHREREVAQAIVRKTRGWKTGSSSAMRSR